MASTDVKAKTSNAKDLILGSVLLPLSEPWSSPCCPESQTDLEPKPPQPPQVYLKHPWTWITIKNVLASDITGSLQTGALPSLTFRVFSKSIFLLFPATIINNVSARVC